MPGHVKTGTKNKEEDPGTCYEEFLLYYEHKQNHRSQSVSMGFI